MLFFQSRSPARAEAIAARGVSEGFAVGRAVRLEAAPGEGPLAGSGRVSLRRAVEQVRDDLRRLVRALPSREAELFEPEARILEEIATRLLAREGEREAAEAIVAETSCGCTDLVIDLRVRLLHALDGSPVAELSDAAAGGGADLVVVTDLVTPTLVASLPPRVVAVVGALDAAAATRRHAGRQSHAAILARGRGLPVALVSSEALGSIPSGSRVIVEVAGDGSAFVAVDPDEARLAAAADHGRRREAAQNDVGREPLDRLGVEVRVNVGSLLDAVPHAAQGVGLVRTELAFAGRRTAPSESEQLAALLLIAGKARGRPVVVRLFDAGGDKPLAWLGGASDLRRGVGRLLAYPQILATQLRALARAREHADIRVLLPFVRSAEEVRSVRRRASPALPIGAMIESPDAVEASESIAAAADFVSLGTNDLTATTLGLDRSADDPGLRPRVLASVRRSIAAAHAHGREVTVCGEMAADERGARISVGLGADVLSVAPTRWAAVRRVLARATMESCLAEATASLRDDARAP